MRHNGSLAIRHKCGYCTHGNSTANLCGLENGIFLVPWYPRRPPQSLEIFFGGVVTYTWINDQAGYPDHLFMITLPKPLPERRHDIAISPPHCIFSQTTRSRLNRLCQLATREHEPEKIPTNFRFWQKTSPFGNSPGNVSRPPICVGFKYRDRCREAKAPGEVKSGDGSDGLHPVQLYLDGIRIGNNCE